MSIESGGHYDAPPEGNPPIIHIPITGMSIIKLIMVVEEVVNKVVDENDGGNEEVNEGVGCNASEGDVSGLEGWYEDIANYDHVVDYGIDKAKSSRRDLPVQGVMEEHVNVEIPARGALVDANDVVPNDPMVEDVALVDVVPTRCLSGEESLAIIPRKTSLSHQCTLFFFL